MLTATVVNPRQVEAIAAALRVFCVPGQVVEVRALHVAGRNAISVVGNDIEQLALRAAELDQAGAKGVYFTPNPLRPDLLGRKTSARTEDVSRRHWLLIDADPLRADNGSTKGSTSAAERQAAWELLIACRDTLEGAGLSGPVVADSGNGWHLCYPIDLPNDTAATELVRAVLKGLAKIVNTESVQLDTGTPANAATIWKLYGTTARKGEPTAERPHRHAGIVDGQPWEEGAAARNTTLLTRLLEMWKWVEDARKRRPPGTPVDRAIAYLAKVPPAIEGQNGSDRCYQAAGVAVNDFGLDADQALQALQDWNRTCKPPWSEKELRHKIESVLKKPADKPRGWRLGDKTTVNGAPVATAAGGETPRPEDLEQPIPLSALPLAPAFPLDTIPERLRAYVQEVAWATNTPLDFTAVPLLAVAAGAIGNSRQLSITRTHRQPACLFMSVVGAPGTGKSAPLDMVKEPLEQAEHAFHQSWKEAVAAWEKTDFESRGQKPPMRRCMLDDTTTEAMVRIMADNVRGLVMVRDELSALVTGMNQYKEGGKGNDRQTYLKIWSGATIRVDRKSNPDGIPVSVRRPFACIIGGIQPQVIEAFRGEQENNRPPPDDGFLDRFLISYPDPLPAVGERWREVSTDAVSTWEAVVNALLDLRMYEADDGSYLPGLAPLTDTGKLSWARLTQEHADEVNAIDFPEWLRGPWSKLVPGYAGRLALVLHYLRWACGETNVEAVEGVSVEGAFALIGYFKGHARKILSALGADHRVKDARRILAWIDRRPDASTFSRRDVLRDLSHFKAPEAIEAPLKLLAEHGFIRSVDDATAPRQQGGRKPSPRYEVNTLYTRRVTDRTDRT